MRRVILRDDDTHALTPVGCLERLYRPFLDRGWPVNLATIPNVRTDARTAEGDIEGFLPRSRMLREAGQNGHAPMTRGGEVASYLRANPGFRIVQHGWDHSLFELETDDRKSVRALLQRGADILVEAGLGPTSVFVAPYDRFSRASLGEVARHFRVVSTGWFELRRLPPAWWPRYIWKKVRRRPHWRVGGAHLLSHPGCLLSHRRPRATMLQEVQRAVESGDLTVLVTHWWEYFPDGRPDEPFISILHQVAAWLERQADVEVIAFEDLVKPRPDRRQVSPLVNEAGAKSEGVISAR